MRVTAVALGCAVMGSASAAVMFFNSTTPAGNAAERATWMTAAGIGSPTYLEDFEAIALDTNVHGVTLTGGLVITDTSGPAAAFVRGDSSFFGGSNPVGTRSLAHNELAYLQLDFAGGVDYVGGLDIDHTGTGIIVTYSDSSTSTHTLEGTGVSGDSAEFWGFYRNDQPKIVRLQMNAAGDGEWGIDNIEFGPEPVPEPATMALVGFALGAVVRRRSRKS